PQVFIRRLRRLAILAHPLDQLASCWMYTWWHHALRTLRLRLIVAAYAQLDYGWLPIAVSIARPRPLPRLFLLIRGAAQYVKAVRAGCGVPPAPCRRWRQEGIGQPDRYRTIEIDIRQPARSRAELQADVAPIVKIFRDGLFRARLGRPALFVGRLAS